MTLAQGRDMRALSPGQETTEEGGTEEGGKMGDQSCDTPLCDDAVREACLHVLQGVDPAAATLKILKVETCKRLGVGRSDLDSYIGLLRAVTGAYFNPSEEDLMAALRELQCADGEGQSQALPLEALQTQFGVDLNEPEHRDFIETQWAELQEGPSKQVGAWGSDHDDDDTGSRDAMLPQASSSVVGKASGALTPDKDGSDRDGGSSSDDGSASDSSLPAASKQKTKTLDFGSSSSSDSDSGSGGASESDSQGISSKVKGKGAGALRQGGRRARKPRQRASTLLLEDPSGLDSSDESSDDGGGGAGLKWHSRRSGAPTLGKGKSKRRAAIVAEEIAAADEAQNKQLREEQKRHLKELQVMDESNLKEIARENHVTLMERIKARQALIHAGLAKTVKEGLSVLQRELQAEAEEGGELAAALSDGGQVEEGEPHEDEGEPDDSDLDQGVAHEPSVTVAELCSDAPADVVADAVPAAAAAGGYGSADESSASSDDLEILPSEGHNVTSVAHSLKLTSDSNAPTASQARRALPKAMRLLSPQHSRKSRAVLKRQLRASAVHHFNDRWASQLNDGQGAYTGEDHVRALKYQELRRKQKAQQEREVRLAEQAALLQRTQEYQQEDGDDEEVEMEDVVESCAAEGQNSSELPSLLVESQGVLGDVDAASGSDVGAGSDKDSEMDEEEQLALAASHEAMEGLSGGEEDDVALAGITGTAAGSDSDAGIEASEMEEKASLPLPATSVPQPSRPRLRQLGVQKTYGRHATLGTANLRQEPAMAVANRESDQELVDSECSNDGESAVGALQSNALDQSEEMPAPVAELASGSTAGELGVEQQSRDAELKSLPRGKTLNASGQLEPAPRQKTLATFFAAKPKESKQDAAAEAVDEAKDQACNEGQEVSGSGVVEAQPEPKSLFAHVTATAGGKVDVEPEPDSQPEDEQEVQEEKEPKDRTAAYRKILERDQALARKNKRVRRGGLMEQEAEEEEEEEAVKGLGDFGFGVAKADAPEDDNEDNADVLRPGDLDNIVDTISDDEGDDKGVGQTDLQTKQAREKDRESLKEMVSRVRDGFGDQRRGGRGTTARGNLRLDQLTAADRSSRREARKLGLLNADEEWSDNERGGADDEAEEEEIDEVQLGEMLAREQRMRHLGISAHTQQMLESSDEETEIEAVEGGQDGAELGEEDLAEERMTKKWSHRARVRRVLEESQSQSESQTLIDSLEPDEGSQDILSMLQCTNSNAFGCLGAARKRPGESYDATLDSGEVLFGHGMGMAATPAQVLASELGGASSGSSRCDTSLERSSSTSVGFSGVSMVKNVRGSFLKRANTLSSSAHAHKTKVAGSKFVFTAVTSEDSNSNTGHAGGVTSLANLGGTKRKAPCHSSSSLRGKLWKGLGTETAQAK